MKKCPPGVICTDKSTVWLAVVVAVFVGAAVFYFAPKPVAPVVKQQPVYIMAQPQIQPVQQVQRIQDPPPLRRYNTGAVQQVGILAAHGGSSSSASPDRTILPLFGRELDVRRGRWNYYTRTDGSNPVQVPVRFGNRQCDDTYNGCNEVYDDDSVHVPALGRSFKASIYKVAF